MDKKELRKANGDVFFEANRKIGNSYIYVNWIGIQSLESIMMGGNLLLNMLRHKACSSILNSNHELIGPWEEGALYLGNNWASSARILGLLNFAHVLSPGIYGQRSFQKFENLATKHLHIQTFATDEEAAIWLLT